MFSASLLVGLILLVVLLAVAIVVFLALRRRDTEPVASGGGWSHDATAPASAATVGRPRSGRGAQPTGDTDALFATEADAQALAAEILANPQPGTDIDATSGMPVAASARDEGSADGLEDEHAVQSASEWADSLGGQASGAPAQAEEFADSGLSAFADADADASSDAVDQDPGDPGADDPGADDHGADDHGADDPGADDHGADDHGADDPGADDHGAEQDSPNEGGEVSGSPPRSGDEAQGTSEFDVDVTSGSEEQLGEPGPTFDDGAGDSTPLYRTLRERLEDTLGGSETSERADVLEAEPEDAAFEPVDVEPEPVPAQAEPAEPDPEPTTRKDDEVMSTQQSEDVQSEEVLSEADAVEAAASGTGDDAFPVVRISELHEVVDGGFGIGSAAPIADGAQPLGHPIKANTDTKTYQDLSSPWYSQTQPDVWFLDVGFAERAGFHRAE